MTTIKEITKYDEIEPGVQYVVVEYGDVSGSSRHSRGLNIQVDRNLSDDQRMIAFELALDEAKKVAECENIRVIYVKK